MAAATRGSMVTLFLLLASLLQTALAVTHTVGGPAGWTLSQNPTFYDDWAAKENFVVGDKLAFVSTTNHNVYEVSATDADACETNNPLDVFLSASPTVTLSTAGTHGFICAVSGHCVLGMKMIVEVVTVAAFFNDTSPPPTKFFGAGPMLSPPEPPPSSAFGLRSSLAFVVGAALSVIVPRITWSSANRDMENARLPMIHHSSPLESPQIMASEL